MKGLFLILFLIIFSLQNSFAQSNLNKFHSPDTLIIDLFDSNDRFPPTYTYISIKYYNGSGSIYTYNLHDYFTYESHNSHYFKRGYFDSKICDSIVQLINDCKIDSVINDSEHKSYKYRGTGDLAGNCHFYLSKNDENFSKTVNYVIYYGIDREYTLRDFYNKLNKYCIKLTNDIPLVDLLYLHETFDFPLDDIYFKKGIIGSAIRNIRDTLEIGNMINLYNSGLFQDAVMYSFGNMESDKIITFLNSLLNTYTNANSTEIWNQYTVLSMLAYKSNDSLKIIYYNRALQLNDSRVRFRSARELAKLKDSSGVQILLNTLDDYRVGLTWEAIDALVLLDNKSVIDSLILKYYKVKNNDSIPYYKKDDILGYYIYGLNRLLYIEAKMDTDESYYRTHLDQEMEDVEKAILQYLNKKN